MLDQIDLSTSNATALCIAAISMTGPLLAVWGRPPFSQHDAFCDVTCSNHGRDVYRCGTSTLLGHIFVVGLVAVLTAGAAVARYASFDSDLDRNIPIALALVAGAILCIISPFKLQPIFQSLMEDFPKSPQQILDIQATLYPLGILVAIFALVPGLTLLVCFGACHPMSQNLLYQGPMYISEYTTDPSPDAKRDAYHNHGIVQVEFGYPWACSVPNTRCQADVPVPECDRQSRNEALECVIDTFGLHSFLDGNSFKNANYSHVLAPKHDTSGWPFGRFVGDCHTCKALTPDDFDARMRALDRIKSAGILLSGIGCTSYVLIFGWGLYLHWIHLVTERSSTKHGRTIINEHIF